MAVRKRDRAHDDVCQGDEIKMPMLSQSLDFMHQSRVRYPLHLYCIVYPVPLFVALESRGRADKTDKATLAVRGGGRHGWHGCYTSRLYVPGISRSAVRYIRESVSTYLPGVPGVHR